MNKYYIECCNHCIKFTLEEDLHALTASKCRLQATSTADNIGMQFE